MTFYIIELIVLTCVHGIPNYISNKFDNEKNYIILYGIELTLEYIISISMIKNLILRLLLSLFSLFIFYFLNSNPTIYIYIFILIMIW